jgi:diguanylate cyclase (GGDEF)-like protein/PAS domain S-box-containing protein
MKLGMPERFSAVRLFITLLVIIFVAESALMVLLPTLFPYSIDSPVEAIIDAATLTGIASLFLWWLFVRPLRLALLSKTAQAAAIMDNATEAVITIDERGTIHAFNRAAEKMFGYTVREAIGANVRMLMPEPHVREHDSYLANYLRTGQAKVIGKVREMTALRRDGTLFPIELSVTELKFGGERSYTGMIRDITERKRVEEHIRHVADHDSLTGLPNRMLFYDRLKQSMALARRERHELALLYLDLDGFKAVNDTWGHDAGDELLKAVAARIRQPVRESDTVARIGGDEFTVILPKIASREDTAKAAQKIIEALSAPFQLHLTGQGPELEVSIGASIGITVYPGDAPDIDALIKAADTAMYEAKQTGNAFRFYQL